MEQVWRVNEISSGKGSLNHSKLNYANSDVAAVKYATTYGPGDTWALVMDRTVGNFLEQQGPFLASTWLHALLVPGGSARAAQLSAVYVASRALYPLLFWCGHPWLQFSTCPGYWCVHSPFTPRLYCSLYAITITSSLDCRIIWFQLYRVVASTAHGQH